MKRAAADLDLTRWSKAYWIEACGDEKCREHLSLLLEKMEGMRAYSLSFFVDFRGDRRSDRKGSQRHDQEVL